MYGVSPSRSWSYTEASRRQAGLVAADITHEILTAEHVTRFLVINRDLAAVQVRNHHSKACSVTQHEQHVHQASSDRMQHIFRAALCRARYGSLWAAYPLWQYRQLVV